MDNSKDLTKQDYATGVFGGGRRRGGALWTRFSALPLSGGLAVCTPSPEASMGARKGERRVICENRRARFEYDLEKHTEAGLVLLGSEVKSLRKGNAHLSDAWVGFEGNKPMLFKAHVATYDQATHVCHEADRPRPLLLHEAQIADLRHAVRERGLTLVPLKLLFDGPWVKLEFAVGRGRKNHDKRQVVREREDRREMARALVKVR